MSVIDAGEHGDDDRSLRLGDTSSRPSTPRRGRCTAARNSAREMGVRRSRAGNLPSHAVMLSPSRSLVFPAIFFHRSAGLSQRSLVIFESWRQEESYQANMRQTPPTLYLNLPGRAADRRRKRARSTRSVNCAAPEPLWESPHRANELHIVPIVPCVFDLSLSELKDRQAFDRHRSAVHSMPSNLPTKTCERCHSATPVFSVASQ